MRGMPLLHSLLCSLPRKTQKPFLRGVRCYVLRRAALLLMVTTTTQASNL